MKLFTVFKNLFIVPRNNDELNSAQLRVLSKQVPYQYVVVIANSFVLAYTYYDAAPHLLTLILPILLILFAVLRSIGFIVSRRRVLTSENTRKKLQNSIIVAFLLGSSFTFWSLSLFPYGNDLMKGQVVFYGGITAIGIIACIMPMRGAAIAMIVAVFVPYIIFLFLTENTILAAMAFMLATVSLMIGLVSSGYAKDFAAMIEHQSALITKEAETQKLSDANLRLANQDMLTGLPNRRSFFLQLDAQLAWAHDNNAPLAVGILDLDGFRPVNDIYGHTAGDQLLIEASRRLRDVCGEEAIVVRLGGDQFGLIIPNHRCDKELQAFGDRACDAMKQTFDIPNYKLHMSATCGFACYPAASETAALLFEYADRALCHAKTVCAGNTAFFTEALSKQIETVSGIQRCLQEANFEEEMSLEYQLLVNTDTGRAIGAEALARWHSPVLGRVAPDNFIATAERIGLINKLTQVLFFKALEAAKTWPSDIFVSFNLSSHDIVSEECISALLAIIEQTGFDPKRLTFEITESAVMADFKRAQHHLTLLKAVGAKIALDDFGTGYSSLSYVRGLPLDRLKVDSSFVRGIESDETGQAVMRSIFDLCQNLQLDCVVEGVETADELAILKSLGCHTVQGFLYSRPQKASIVLEKLRAQI